MLGQHLNHHHAKYQYSMRVSQHWADMCATHLHRTPVKLFTQYMARGGGGDLGHAVSHKWVDAAYTVAKLRILTDKHLDRNSGQFHQNDFITCSVLSRVDFKITVGLHGMRGAICNHLFMMNI